MSYIQQYIIFKRGLEAWKKDTRPFPMDVDNAIADTFESLRPKLKLFANLEEASAGVEELEKEYVEKLGECTSFSFVKIIICVWDHHDKVYQRFHGVGILSFIETCNCFLFTYKHRLGDLIRIPFNRVSAM